MDIDKIYKKCLNLEFISKDEALLILKNSPTSELMFVANQIKNKFKTTEDQKKVGWIIDRNINITNVCISFCKFCNFCKIKNSEDAYITTIEEYKEKINNLFKLGGNQILLQGGLHPDLKIDYYENLFSELKHEFPELKLHALGPPEIIHIAKISGLTPEKTLLRLIDSGLDSLPGAGAEILVDRVRNIVSPAKCSSSEWLEIMHLAHKINIPTSATMMFGHVETLEERIEHLIKIRDTQNLKPANSYGFVTFIPWSFQKSGTKLEKNFEINYVNSEEYIRLLALSRIILVNIKNIQASWLTVGKETAQICLHGGANDFGSIMIEENVVSSAGSNYTFDKQGIKQAIIEAGFEPHLRNAKYEFQ